MSATSRTSDCRSGFLTSPDTSWSTSLPSNSMPWTASSLGTPIGMRSLSREREISPLICGASVIVGSNSSSSLLASFGDSFRRSKMTTGSRVSTRPSSAFSTRKVRLTPSMSMTGSSSPVRRTVRAASLTVAVKVGSSRLPGPWSWTSSGNSSCTWTFSTLIVPRSGDEAQSRKIDRSAATSSTRTSRWSLALFKLRPRMDGDENQPKDALSLEAVTLGLARAALIALSRSPVWATIHGAVTISTISRIATMPRMRIIRLPRFFGAGGLAGVCSLMAAPVSKRYWSWSVDSIDPLPRKQIGCFPPHAQWASSVVPRGPMRSLLILFLQSAKENKENEGDASPQARRRGAAAGQPASQRPSQQTRQRQAESPRGAPAIDPAPGPGTLPAGGGPRRQATPGLLETPGARGVPLRRRRHAQQEHRRPPGRLPSDGEAAPRADDAETSARFRRGTGSAGREGASAPARPLNRR